MALDWILNRVVTLEATNNDQLSYEPQVQMLHIVTISVDFLRLILFAICLI